MSQVVRCGLTQLSNPIHDGAEAVAHIREAMLQQPLRHIEQAGREGVQILGPQERLNGPCIGPSHDEGWYAAAGPGPLAKGTPCPSSRC